ncbi:MAG: hypothetical protein EXR81_03320 [Gammaproteobacteria bacterium]|nr:hypothetical protein [Gammaproteobacteria bacterium]
MSYAFRQMVKPIIEPTIMKVLTPEYQEFLRKLISELEQLKIIIVRHIADVHGIAKKIITLS